MTSGSSGPVRCLRPQGNAVGRRRDGLSRREADMASAVVTKRKYTYADYVQLPEDQRYELIEGELQMAPAPTPLHQRVSRKIEFRLEQFVTEHGLGEVFDAPCDVYLDEENVVQPDLFFIRRERLGIIGERNIQGAPDLVIEVVSESSAYRDLVRKKRLYARFGVSEYWVVFPEDRAVEVYVLRGQRFRLQGAYAEDEVLESTVLPGFRLPLKEIFG